MMNTLTLASRPLSLIYSTKSLAARLSVGSKSCASIRSFTIAKAVDKHSQQSMARTDAESAAVEDKQARAAELVVDAAHEKVHLMIATKEYVSSVWSGKFVHSIEQ